MNISIYALIDPRTNNFRYVGKSADPYKRYGTHIRKAKIGCKTHCRKWIATLLKEQKLPEIIILETVYDNDSANESERKWIAILKYLDYDLTNKTIGGDGRAKGSKLSQETRDKMSASRKGKPLPLHVIEKARLARLGKKRPLSELEPMWNANRGRKQSNEEIEKRVSKIRGKAPRPAGWKHSEEAKLKIGESSIERKSAAIALAARWNKNA